MDIDELSTLFNHCNDKYFDGRLPEPKFRVSHSRTRLGSFSYKMFRGRSRRRLGVFHLPSFGRAGGDSYLISISDYYLMSPDQLEDVMTHEMIHYSIAYTGLKDSAPHGVVFRGMMDAINRKYGRHISVIASTRGWKPRVEPKPQTYLVLGLKMDNGTFFLSSVNPSSAGKLEMQIRRIPDIVFHKWVETKDDYFRSFPRARSLRGRRVTKELFESKIG